MKFKRVIWIVLDSVGIGEMPDAASYGDAGSDTLGNIARQRPLHLPTLCRLGLGKIKKLRGLCEASQTAAEAAYGKCALASPGKDTTTGHWEMAGIILDKPLPVFPNGFPADLIKQFEQQTCRRVIGNKVASGTEIIQELGSEQMRSGALIVYTSADSVFQVAAHEDVVPLNELYKCCEIARDLLHDVGRVIARPFTGETGAFKRTANRHDYALPPPDGMLLDQLSDAGIPVYTIGKIADIFLNRGISHSEKTNGNEDGMRKTQEAMRQQENGLIFVNLVDFDMLYGHRNDVEGYALALEKVDSWLPGVDLEPNDMLILTADHGCDPTTASTDHSREYTPLLVYGKNVRPDTALGTRASLADIGATVAENFNTNIAAGMSFLSDLQI